MAKKGSHLSAAHKKAISDGLRRRYGTKAFVAKLGRDRKAHFYAYSNKYKKILRYLEEDASPVRGAFGGKLVRYEHGHAYYSDGSERSAAGWDRGTRQKRAQRKAEIKASLKGVVSSGPSTVTNVLIGSGKARR